ncbi:MAG: butyrate kinase [Planctomycetota bacterium]
MRKIIVINPGSTSTKLAFFNSEENFLQWEIQHTVEEFSKFERVYDQLEIRFKRIIEFLKEKVDFPQISAIAARGGLAKPLKSGTYIINELLIEDLRNSMSRWGMEHPANLGAPLAKKLQEYLKLNFNKDIPAFIVDPISVDDFEPVAKITGLYPYERYSLYHALNQRSVARIAVKQIGKSFENANLIGVHMGGGISVVAFKNGKGIDSNVALLGYGPFSPQRTGTLAIQLVIKLCFSGKYTEKDLRTLLGKKGGLYSYFQTDDAKVIEKKILEGDKKAELVYYAMAYNIAKEIGAMASVLMGKVDLIFLTGGLAKSQMLVNWIKERIEFIAPVFIYPGEREMQALAEGAYRVLKGEENARQYS